VLVALRPEKVSIATSAPEGAENSVAGEIETWSYFGTSFHFKVATPELGEITVTSPTWRSEVAPEAGRKVWLSWGADATVLVRDD
jgi:ABC-type Fe3+/spermidine/putrescine transport system ATPase subunit